MQFRTLLVFIVGMAIGHRTAGVPQHRDETITSGLTKLCVSRGLDLSTTTSMVADGTVYGIFPDFVIASCSERAMDTYVGVVGELTVLEQVFAEGNFTPSVSEWQKAIQGMNIVFESMGRVIVRNFDAGALPRTISRWTVVLPVISTPVKPTTTNTRLASMKATIAKNPLIERYISEIDSARAKTYLEYLTGQSSTIKTRNSIAPDGMVAAEWLKREFESLGFDTALETFQDGYNPNVIATLKGEIEPDTYVIVGAHYDSRGQERSSATALAPGANDDGSGTSALLQIARVIHENSLDFRYSIIIGAWSGEEQGLVGSRAYAKACKDKGMDILAMLQADMIAFRSPNEGVQCGFPDRYADPLLTDLAQSLMNQYTPDIETCFTPACCSDHQSFTEQGYSATQFFERCGGIIDDKYHNAGDIIDRPGFDLDGELVAMSRALAAITLTIADFQG
eukprot:m.179985 g.179985  ORF g.179985 m.179985 type:complete len:452 (+) comp18405_c0_seq1:162-1517(+)